jgi:tRNA threonylcarbamoyl adenosine modification protein (Sua5/YciO/YrdC/YwlC family)
MRHLCWGESEAVQVIKDLLSAGEVVLGDSDTVLGLLADTSIEGKASLDRIKKRVEKPYLVLVKNAKIAQKYIVFPPDHDLQFEKLINICWPGPVTLIFTARPGVESWITSQNGTIGLRVPDHAGLQALLRYFSALFSTSANTAGSPVPKSIEDVEPEVLAAVSAVVLDEEVKTEIPSTILDCTGPIVKVIRQGSVDVDRLARESGLRIEKL